MPSTIDAGATELIVPGLRILVSCERHLLAMKMLAARERDVPDLVLVFGRLGITTTAQAVSMTDEVFGETYPVDRPPTEYLEALAADVLDAR